MDQKFQRVKLKQRNKKNAQNPPSPMNDEQKATKSREVKLICFVNINTPILQFMNPVESDSVS